MQPDGLALTSSSMLSAPFAASSAASWRSAAVTRSGIFASGAIRSANARSSRARDRKRSRSIFVTPFGGTDRSLPCVLDGAVDQRRVRIVRRELEGLAANPAAIVDALDHDDPILCRAWRDVDALGPVRDGTSSRIMAHDRDVLLLERRAGVVTQLHANSLAEVDDQRPIETV